MLGLSLRIYLATLLLPTLASEAEPTRHLCFSRSYAIWLANLDGTAWDPCWLNAQEYLFTSTLDGRNFGIYKLSLTGKIPQLVVSNASSVTVSAR
jgi:hypothetical protein